MPREGYRSITVKQDVYEYLMEEYKKRKKEWLVENGISSFTGYVTYRLSELMKLDKQRNLG